MNIFKLTSTSILISSAILATGCSSDSGGGGGAQVPKNAIVITDANAETTIASSVTSVESIDSALSVLGAETTPTLGLLAMLDKVEPYIDNAKNAAGNSGADPVYASGVTFSENCTVSGSISGSFNSTGTDPNFNDSASVTFSNCDYGLGSVINGNFSSTSSWNYVTGEYSDTAKGSLSITTTSGSTTFKISFTGLDFAESGNDINGTYTVTKAKYAVDFVTNGTSNGGFAVALTAPIVESSGGFFSCPESGAVKVTGGNGSTAEGIYNGDGTMTIKANGTVVNSSAPCYY